MSAVTENLRGALAMAVAMTLIVINDSMIKLVSETLPTAQTIGVRGLFATACVGAALLASGQGRRMAAAWERNTLWRAAMDIVGTFAYLIAMFRMPLAEATAINMAAPLLIVILAVVFLRERVAWARWAAVLVGFVGTLLVVRPGGDAFSVWAALAAAATVLTAARDIVTRRIPAGVPSLVVGFVTASTVMAAGCIGAGLEGWQPMTWRQLGLLAGAGAFLAAGYYLTILAMRTGEASFVGGFRYACLPAAALLGWVGWGHVPDLPASLGMAVLVGAGLYLLRSQRATTMRKTGW
jgi:drug/metabolite transporter (DMT)-like permease